MQARRAGLLPPLRQLIFFEGGLRQAKCHVVAQTQGYHLVCIWGSLRKFQGGGVVLKFVVFSHCYAVFSAICMQAMTHSVDNVPSQQAVKSVVCRTWFCWAVLVWIAFGRPVAMKNWGNGFAIGDANTKIGPIKCLIFQTGEESFTFVTFKTDIS